MQGEKRHFTIVCLYPNDCLPMPKRLFAYRQTNVCLCANLNVKMEHAFASVQTVTCLLIVAHDGRKKRPLKMRGRFWMINFLQQSMHTGLRGGLYINNPAFLNKKAGLLLNNAMLLQLLLFLLIVAISTINVCFSYDIIVGVATINVCSR